MGLVPLGLQINIEGKGKRIIIVYSKFYETNIKMQRLDCVGKNIIIHTDNLLEICRRQT